MMNSKKGKARKRAETTSVKTPAKNGAKKRVSGKEGRTSELDQAPTDSALIAILAAILDPQALKDNAGPAIRRAEQIVRAVPQYLDGKNLDLKELTEALETDLKWKQEAREWGFPELLSSDFFEYQEGKLPEGVISFKQEEVVKNVTGGEYKTVRGLESLLKTVGYPKPLLQRRLITKVGYNLALEERNKYRRELDLERKQKKSEIASRNRTRKSGK
jgi:hypothetical protein